MYVFFKTFSIRFFPSELSTFTSEFVCMCVECGCIYGPGQNENKILWKEEEVEWIKTIVHIAFIAAFHLTKRKKTQKNSEKVERERKKTTQKMKCIKVLWAHNL